MQLVSVIIDTTAMPNITRRQAGATAFVQSNMFISPEKKNNPTKNPTTNG